MLKQSFSKLIDFFTVPADREGAVCEVGLGLPGSGKSLYQVEKQLLPHIIKNEVVYSTQWINCKLPTIHYFNNIESVLDVRNAVFGIDEVGQILPARQWSNETLDIQKFFQLHRHRHNDIYCNTQDVSLVAKTIGIVATNWIRLKKIERGYFLRLIEKHTKKKAISFNFQELPFAMIKKIASGEIDDTPKDVDDLSIPVDNYNAYDDFYFGGDTPDKLSDKWDTLRFSFDALYHDELNDIKAELVHYYCPECKSRQGQFIPIEETKRYARQVDKHLYEPIYKVNCVKHGCLLDLRKSFMFDSYYEPEVEEKEIVFKPYFKATKWANYVGSLSPEQLNLKKQLENIKLNK